MGDGEGRIREGYNRIIREGCEAQGSPGRGLVKEGGREGVEGWSPHRLGSRDVPGIYEGGREG